MPGDPHSLWEFNKRQHSIFYGTPNGAPVGFWALRRDYGRSSSFANNRENGLYHLQILRKEIASEVGVDAYPEMLARVDLDVGVVRLAHSEFEPAMKRLSTALGKCRDVFGEDHELTRIAMFELTTAYALLGEAEKADALRVELLEAR